MSALVSVVIPTYNRANDLKRALASVVAQTWGNWEAVVVDNHSADNTREVVEAFREARIRLLSVHNEGVIAVSRNLGVANARGEFVAFLDSDDWWVPTKLERSMQALSRGADVVYHDLHIVRPGRKWWHSKTAATRPLA
jgi:glycosyltransferase involved in cell wall biosynthesis